MPNGESKNWIRLMITLESFYILYGDWPTMIHLYSFFIDELKTMLSSEDFIKLQSKLELISDDENPFLALDKAGNRFDYSRCSPPKGEPKLRAIDWLNIKEPDYYD